MKTMIGVLEFCTSFKVQLHTSSVIIFYWDQIFALSLITPYLPWLSPFYKKFSYYNLSMEDDLYLSGPMKAPSVLVHPFNEDY